MEKPQIVKYSTTYDELVELYKKKKRTKLKGRSHALVLMHEFKTCTIVAELVKKSLRMIQLIVNAFNEGGVDAIVPNAPPERPSKLLERQKEQLKANVLTHPRKLGYEFSNWEGKSVVHHIKQKFGVDLSVRQAQRLLHKLGFTLQCSRYNFPKADPEKQKEFLKEFKKKGSSRRKRCSSLSRRSKYSILSDDHSYVVVEGAAN